MRTEGMLPTTGGGGGGGAPFPENKNIIYI